jgi:hypothetical protein
VDCGQKRCTLKEMRKNAQELTKNEQKGVLFCKKLTKIDTFLTFFLLPALLIDHFRAPSLMTRDSSEDEGQKTEVGNPKTEGVSRIAYRVKRVTRDGISARELVLYGGYVRKENEVIL